MKNYLIVFLAVTIFYVKSYAQDTTNVIFKNFVASKSSERKLYPIGTRLFIRYTNERSTNKLRGIIAGLNKTKIFIKQGKKDSLISINIIDITLVRKIDPRGRIILGIVGTALVGGGAAFIDDGGNSPGSAMRDALIIPIIGVGSFCLHAVPITLFIEKIDERRRSNGWIFQSF